MCIEGLCGFVRVIRIIQDAGREALFLSSFSKIALFSGHREWIAPAGSNLGQVGTGFNLNDVVNILYKL